VNRCPYLRSEILLLDELYCAEQTVRADPETETDSMEIAPAVPETKTMKKATKPKWLKL